MKKNEAKWIIVVCVLLGIGALMSGCPGLVAFRDKGLESAIRKKLVLPFGFLSKADLLELWELDGSERVIQDLTGLEHCTNLRWLDLEGNTISDITPLSTLKNLTFLSLASNDIRDLQPLAGLFYLKDLWLSNNEIMDLTPLVDNAEVGGIGYGTVIVLSEESLLTEDGEISAVIADQIDRLAELGVTVVVTTTTPDIGE